MVFWCLLFVVHSHWVNTKLRYYLCAGQYVVVIFTQFERFANIYYRSLAHGMLFLLLLLLLLLLATRYGFFSQVVYCYYAMSHCFFATLPHAQFDSHCCFWQALRRRCRSRCRCCSCALFSTVLVPIKPTMRRCAALSLSARAFALSRLSHSLSRALLFALLNWFDWPLAFVR